MIKTDLGGHSGCKIVLCEPDQGDVFVRKISSSIDYNSRLKKQKEKQKKYHSNKIKVPKILNEGYQDDGLYFFDMEYIQGITMAEYIKGMEVSKIKSFVDDLLEDIIDFDNCGESDVGAFLNKINALNDKLSDLQNPIINKALSILKEHNWKYFHESSCHGDMTLENIIISNNSIYLIDFLDSFYNSWILDLSTILQDVQTLWHYRNDGKININTIIRLIIMRDILVDKMKKLMGANYIEVYYALLLKLIRIYPYTNDEITYEFLNTKTKDIIELIEMHNSNDEKRKSK
ncbi:phosphotransferase [Selenomonas montiformis]|uniref:phosphotransferase n=1 Tax=Selenomonas montiformis TaxID=2652285 RepID=UPI0039F59BF6